MKRIYWVGIIAICLVVLATIFILNKPNSNKEFALPENPLLSHSKKYQLQVVEGFNGLVHYYRFDIAKMGEVGTDPEVVFSSKDTFRTNDTLYILWDDQDRVWVYSGDVGVFYWARVNESFWNKHIYQGGDIAPPAALKKVRPEYFQSK